MFAVSSVMERVSVELFESQERVMLSTLRLRGFVATYMHYFRLKKFSRESCGGTEP